MPIWFVYRSPYHGPMSKYVRRFARPNTLLEWFHSVWRAIPRPYEAEAYRHAERVLGTRVCGFGHLFIGIAEDNDPPPETMDELHAVLEGALFGGEYRGTEDTIQVL